MVGSKGNRKFQIFFKTQLIFPSLFILNDPLKNVEIKNEDEFQKCLLELILNHVLLNHSHCRKFSPSCLFHCPFQPKCSQNCSI